MQPHYNHVLLEDVKDGLSLSYSFRGRQCVVHSRLHEKTVDLRSLLKVVAEVREIFKVEEEQWVDFCLYRRCVHLLPPQATGEVIAGAVFDIRSITEEQNTTAAIYSNTHWTKVILCRKVYAETRLICLFIEILQSSIGCSMRAYCNANKMAPMQSLAGLLTTFADFK